MRVATLVLLVIAASLAACQIRSMGLLSAPSAPVALADVRNSLGMGTYDSVVGSHSIVVRGHYAGPDGAGTFRRVYEPSGAFKHYSKPTNAEESLQRFDGDVLWVEVPGGNSYPMTHTRSQLSCSVEWILSGRWLAPGESPFRATAQSPFGVEQAPGFALQLREGGPEATVRLSPVDYKPQQLEIAGRSGHLNIALTDWRTRRGFAWPHSIRIDSENGRSTALTTTEVLFEPSVDTVNANKTKRKRMQDVTFVLDGPRSVPLRRGASGHMLVRPKLMGKEVGWFLVDTGTGVNCLDPRTLQDIPQFLAKDTGGGRAISIIGLGGSVESKIVMGGDFALGSLRAKNMEWVTLDLTDLQEVVGVRLAGVLGGEFFDRALVEIDLLGGTLVLHDSRTFDASRLPWRPLRFDGTTPCVQAGFAPNHEGWFRLDTGSDDTVTFHSPWVRKLRMVDNATNLIPMRLKGIGGEIRAIRGRIRWFDLMGQRFPKPKVTMVERATGPLANPDLCGNIGVGFFTGQRLILDYPAHRVALIPR
ncbi:MAG: hypothetical protein ACI87O_001148 [Planctomycetota bacterium]|jgi:hypothetical protein